MKKNNIIFVGLMGAGKSTIGKYLSNKLMDYNFVDTDTLIEEKCNMTISEIFKQKTETGFRDIESEVIKNICKSNYLIISTGGGAFENEKNRNVLLNSGKVFYLYAPSEVLYDRIKTKGNRPLLKCNNPKEELGKLLDKRDINYRKAHYIIDTDNLTEELVTNEILRRLNETVNIS